MNVQSSRHIDHAEGQATFGMANLRREKTGLPFIVFISQREGARHAARVKVAPEPRVTGARMSSYAIDPFGYKAGVRLSADEQSRLAAWIALNANVLQRYWNGEIAYTEDALDGLRPV